MFPDSGDPAKQMCCHNRARTANSSRRPSFSVLFATIRYSSGDTTEFLLGRTDANSKLYSSLHLPSSRVAPYLGVISPSLPIPKFSHNRVTCTHPIPPSSTPRVWSIFRWIFSLIPTIPPIPLRPGLAARLSSALPEDRMYTCGHSYIYTLYL
jgi:hypothetical protein